jgi:L-2-hydroxycarboxylate dehydrogenase (NAD+)
MLDRFYVPPDDRVRVTEGALRRTVAEIFEGVGVPPEDAAEGANTLVASDLRGMESHGVSNMLRNYVMWFRSGRLNPTPEWKIVREWPGTASIDGDGGLGVIQGPRAMRIAIEKARTVGVGIVTIQNSGHLGAVGHHAMLAAEADMVGVCMTAAGLRVLPTFGRIPRLGTNPISIAAPARTEPYMLFDAATSAVAGNKIVLAERVGALMEPGWVAGLDGAPITDAQPVPPRGEFNQLPLGGTREQGSHKGYGLALMVEVLSTLLAGGIPTMLDPESGAKHYFAAYNIEAFTDLDGFKDTMDHMLQALQETPPAAGEEQVIYPGLPEHEHERDRRANGIPLHTEVVGWFDGITAELGISPLERLSG